MAHSDRDRHWEFDPDRLAASHRPVTVRLAAPTDLGALERLAT